MPIPNVNMGKVYKNPCISPDASYPPSTEHKLQKQKTRTHQTQFSAKNHTASPQPTTQEPPFPNCPRHMEAKIPPFLTARRQWKKEEEEEEEEDDDDDDKKSTYDDRNIQTTKTAPGDGIHGKEPARQQSAVKHGDPLRENSKTSTSSSSRTR
jgi:hypothetical protein